MLLSSISVKNYLSRILYFLVECIKFNLFESRNKTFSTNKFLNYLAKSKNIKLVIRDKIYILWWTILYIYQGLL